MYNKKHRLIENLIVVEINDELFALKKSIYLNKANACSLSSQIIKVIKQNDFWYKQIVQASIYADCPDIFYQIYSPKKLVKFNLSNVGIKILHSLAPTLDYDQFVDLMKKFIIEKSVVKLKTLMLYWDLFAIPDVVWSKLLENPCVEIFEYLMSKVNYEYPKYLFERPTDLYVGQWIDFIPEKYIGEISQFISKSICGNKINYLKIVLPKCKNLANNLIKPNELKLLTVSIDTFSYVISSGLINLRDLNIFNTLINKIIFSELVGVLKPLLSDKTILDHIRMVHNIDFVSLKFLPLEVPHLVSSIAALPIEYKKIKIFNLFLSKGVYSQNKTFWLEHALVTDSIEAFDQILDKCDYFDIVDNNHRLIYIAASKPKYLVKILEKFNKFDNFDPEYYSSLFYRELYSNINKLNDKIISSIPSTYNPLYIPNVLLSSRTTRNEFSRIVNEHKDLIESNLDIILDELIQLNLDLSIAYLIESFPDPLKYEESYAHLLSYLSANSRPNMLFVDLCEFFSSEINLRIDNDYLFTQLFPSCKQRQIYDYFVNKFPDVYSYFVNRKSEVIGIKIGSKIIGQESDGFIGLNSLKISCIEVCSICCETKSNVITKCSHQYCLGCLTKWYNQSKDSCPICRQEYYPISRIELK